MHLNLHRNLGSFSSMYILTLRDFKWGRLRSDGKFYVLDSDPHTTMSEFIIDVLCFLQQTETECSSIIHKIIEEHSRSLATRKGSNQVALANRKVPFNLVVLDQVALLSNHF